RGDEFITPTVVGEPSPIGAGDAVIFFNFRGDRPRELIKAFVYDEFPYHDGTVQHGFDRGEKISDLYFCTLTEYEHGLPVHVAFDRPEPMVNILGEYAASLGLRQF